MARKWEAFIDGLPEQGEALAKTELKRFIRELQADTDAFARRQGEKLALYLEQLAEGQITPDDFRGFVQDIHALTQMRALLVSATAKRKLQKLGVRLSELVLRGLIAAL